MISLGDTRNPEILPTYLVCAFNSFIKGYAILNYKTVIGSNNEDSIHQSLFPFLLRLVTYSLKALSI